MADVLERVGGNPDRSGHLLSIEATRVMYETRELIARFLYIEDPLRLIFANNAIRQMQ